jgi:retron-type reverse transcriptase
MKRCPKIWKKEKTILLYKGGNQGDPANSRPITLTSIFYRIIYGRISQTLIQSDNRAKGTIFSHSQKGFIPRLSGCVQHLTVATMAINQALMRKENLFILAIDLKDAFGSVSHKLLEHNLQKLGISNNITGMIMDSYEEPTVQLTSKNGYTGDITLKRGVKQGCPLSPILFNACIDPLIKRLNL